MVQIMAQVKVLLVDDEKDYAVTLKERLQLRGYDVQAACTVEDAFEAADSSNPEVILLDMKMPGMDGADVFNRLKSSHPDVEIIIVSGQGAMNERAKEISGRAFDYLIKPVEIQDVARKIQEAWEKRSSRLPEGGRDAGGKDAN
ncbi:MAG: response regulator [Nitrospirae bacterium]|nr:response regulator [Nitrospirota bacterium]